MLVSLLELCNLFFCDKNLLIFVEYIYYEAAKCFWGQWGLWASIQGTNVQQQPRYVVRSSPTRQNGISNSFIFSFWWRWVPLLNRQCLQNSAECKKWNCLNGNGMVSPTYPPMCRIPSSINGISYGLRWKTENKPSLLNTRWSFPILLYVG